MVVGGLAAHGLTRGPAGPLHSEKLRQPGAPSLGPAQGPQIHSGGTRHSLGSRTRMLIHLPKPHPHRHLRPTGYLPASEHSRTLLSPPSVALCQHPSAHHIPHSVGPAARPAGPHALPGPCRAKGPGPGTESPSQRLHGVKFRCPSQARGGQKLRAAGRAPWPGLHAPRAPPATLPPAGMDGDGRVTAAESPPLPSGRLEGQPREPTVPWRLARHRSPEEPSLWAGRSGLGFRVGSHLVTPLLGTSYGHNDDTNSPGWPVQLP